MTRITLTDDGTLDTVLRCTDCGAEMRYVFDPGDDRCPEPKFDPYGEFVEWAIEDAENHHECEEEVQP